MDIDTINPHDWNTIAPFFAALEAEELGADGVGDWLTRWSDLEKILGEAGAKPGGRSRKTRPMHRRKRII